MKAAYVIGWVPCGVGKLNKGKGLFRLGAKLVHNIKAEEGQKGEPAIWGRGICKVLCLY